MLHLRVMRLHLLRLFCFSILLCSEAKYRGGRSRRKWNSGSRRRAEDRPAPAPVPVEFIHSTELDAASYTEKVEKVANSTPILIQDKQEYYPFVLFHMSWCAHCKQALPEFERAAQMIAEANKEGKLKGLPELKYFLLQCDKGPEEKAHCDKHAGAGYPLMKLFRDRRSLGFTGNRWAKTIAEWSVQVSRPALLQVEKKEDFSKYIENGVLFMMKSDVVWQPNVLQTWMDLAFQYIEDAYFCVVPIHSEVAKIMEAGAAVDVQGKDIEAFPFEGALNATNLQQWVAFNQWKVVVDMTPEVAVKLMQSGQPVVAFAYRVERRKRFQLSRDKVLPDATFRSKASEIRKGFGPDDKKYLFASMDAAGKEAGDFMSRVFPAASVPGIFVFSGNVTLKSDLVYWESPYLTDADNLTLNVIEDLMLSGWARQDSSTWSWYKSWNKRIYRFGTGSVIGFIVAVFTPCLVLGFCCLCFHELMRADDEEDTVQVSNVPKADHIPPSIHRVGPHSRSRAGHSRAAAMRSAARHRELEALRRRIAEQQQHDEIKAELQEKATKVMVEPQEAIQEPIKVVKPEENNEDAVDKKND